MILEVLPQLCLFGVCFGAAVQQQEDVADRHHDRQVVHHVGAQTLLVFQRVQILTVDHVLCDPQLLVHTADHHAFVHALVCAADEVAVQIQIHIVHTLDVGQGLVHKDIVHIEGVLGQHHAALAQHLGAVHDRVHQQVLIRAEAPDVHPVEQAVLREHVGVAHGMAGAVLNVLVHIVADHQIRRGAAGNQCGQALQHLFQGVGVQPVVAVHYLVVQAGGVADALIDALAVTAVLLMDGLDDGGVLCGVLVADGGGVILDGTIVHQNDLGLLACAQQRFDAVTHIGCGIVAGHGKGDKFLLHIINAPFYVAWSMPGSLRGGMEICVLIIAFSRLKSYPSRAERALIAHFCAK